MGVLNQEGKSRKRKRSEDESLGNENVLEVDTQPKSEKKKKKRASALEDANSFVEKDSKSPQKKEKKRKSEIKSEVDEGAEMESKKGKKRKRKSEVEDDEGEEMQPKKEKKTKKERKSLPLKDEDKETKNGDPQAKEENKSKTEKLISLVLEYLHQWKNDVKTWKFSKYYQACLINFVNDPTVINQEDFETCLQYLKRCRGNGKKKLKLKSQAVIDKEGSGSKGLRKRKQDFDDNCTLFVKNLPYGQTSEEIRDGLQSIFTTAKEIRMPFTSATKYVGFAFVEFSEPSEVASAILEKQGAKLGTRPLYLDRVGDKNKSHKSSKCDQSLSPEFVDTEKQRRAQIILDMY